MSIWGNPVMMGGSGGGGGGGGGNAYAYIAPPTSDIGSNGDYYFELLTSGPSLKNEPGSNANTDIGGWEFKVNEVVAVAGIRALARSSYTGTVKFGLTDGTVLKEVSVDLTANNWIEVIFDAPITLSANTNYIVALLGNSGTLKYQLSPALNTNKISYVRGRYGGFPGTQESSYCYSVDVLLTYQAPYSVKKQYYKTGGTWTEVT